MQESLMEQLWQTSHLAGGNLAYVGAAVEKFYLIPTAFRKSGAAILKKLPRVDDSITADISHSSIREQFLHIAKTGKPMPAPQHRQV